MTSHHSVPPEAGDRTPARATVAAAVGHIVEYYDFAIYALLAPVIAPVFFPTGDPAASLLATFAVFGVAYLIRPLGGLIFGHLADRVGRRRTLSTVILLMSGATAAIGVLPSYATIGVAAPALLVFCRSLQGLSTGGEYSGSASFVAEHAPPHRRGFFTSWVICSTGLGLTIGAAIGTVLTSVVSQAALADWAWRIPFLVALPLGLVGLYLRLKLDDAPAFKAAQAAREAQRKQSKAERPPLLEAVRHHTRAILTLAGLVVLLTTAIYVTFVFMTSYLNAFLGVPLSTALPASVIGFLTFFLATPLFGLLSDRVGRKPVLIAGALAHVLVTVPAFLLLQQRSFVAIAAAYVILGIAYSTYLGPFTATVTEQFPTSVRAASLGIGYNLPVCVFGGLSPLFLTFLVDSTGFLLMPAVYVSAAAVISGLVVLTLRETRPSVDQTGAVVADEADAPDLVGVAVESAKLAKA